MKYHDLLPYDLSENEAKVYLAALELGESSVERIAKKARQNRTTTYHTISLLRNKGLLSVAKHGKKTVYVAEDPNKLKTGLEDKLQSLDALLPELRSIANAIDRKPRVRFFGGFDGLREAALDSLSYPKQEILFWFSDLNPTHEYNTFWFKEYIPKRIKLGIPTRGIGPVCTIGKTMQQNDAKELRQTRMDTRPRFLPRTEIQMYGTDKIGITSHRDMLSLVIESRDLHDTLVSIFESQWDGLG